MNGRTAAGDFPPAVTASDHMSSALGTTLSGAALSMLLVSALAAQATPRVTAPTTLDGIYTAEQAQRGAAVMRDVCADCHIRNWFTGTFLASWNGAPVGYLYDVLSTTMPEDRPGSLPARKYRDVIAYIFELNGLPAGSRELPETKEELDKVLIKQRTP